MHALKYGAVPVARACGGLHEILQDFDPGTASGNAILFYDYHSEALWDAIVRAKLLFAKPAEWEALMLRAMRSDFSWERAAAAYERLYAWLDPEAAAESVPSSPSAPPAEVPPG